MDMNWLNQMVEDLQRQYGFIPPIQPTYQINPQNYMSNPNPSHIHYYSTFDKGDLPHYHSSTYNSNHSPHNSSNKNVIVKEIKELKNSILSLENQKQKSTFQNICPLPPCFQVHNPHVPSNPNPPCNSPNIELNVQKHHLDPLPMPQPPHNPNPPKSTSSPPCNRFILLETLSKYKTKNVVIQSPKVIHPMSSQEIIPKHAIMDSSSPLDPSNSPSHNSLIPQNSFLPLNPSHDPIRNQISRHYLYRTH